MIEVAGDIAKMELGFTLLIVGVAKLMARVAAAEVPPPGEPVITVICAVPPVEISMALTKIVRRVELTNFVARVVPLNCTTEDGAKPAPLTDKVKPVPPAKTAAGFSEVIVGTG